MTLNQSGKIDWITGIKGFCCLTVVALHLLSCVAPTAQNAGIMYVDNTGHYNYIQLTPLNVLFNGSFSVYIFWTLSAFLLSLSFWKSKEGNLLKKEVSKIIRIAIVVIPVSVIAFILLKNGLYYNEQAGNLIEGSFWITERDYSGFGFKELLIELVWSDWVYKSYMIPPLWTMRYEIFGNIFVISVLKTEMYKSKKVMVTLFAICMISNLAPYLCFFIGMYLSYWFYSGRIIKNDTFSSIGFVLGVFFAGYPPTGIPVDGIYTFVYRYIIFPFNTFFNSQNGTHVLYSIGAFLIIFGIVNSRLLQRVYSNVIFKCIGRLSTYIYIVHIPIIWSVGAFVFYKCYVRGMNYYKTIMICCLAATISIFAVSIIIDRFNSKMNTKVRTFIDKVCQ